MKNPILPLFLLLSLAACSVQEPVTPAEAGPSESSTLVPGRATVLLSAEAAAAFAESGRFPQGSLEVTAAERVFPDAGEFEPRHRAAGLDRWYRVEFDRSVPATKAQESLAGLPGVEAVDIPRRKVRRAWFNDEYATDQWNFRNDGSLGQAYRNGFDINVEPVWRSYTAGSSEVIVAVLDGGIDLQHEDLEGVVLRAGEGGSRNFVAGYNPNHIPADDHGTHVAGVIGAINNNGIGVSGIAGGSDGRGGVRLMSCAIFAGTEEDPEGWAADNGAVIANNSWGYAYDTEREAQQAAREFQETESPTRTAIDYFIDNAGTDAQGRQTGPMKGGVVFFASGNEGWAYDAPSSYDRVIAVGAFGPDGKMPRFSNYGTWVDILAPGGSDDSAEEWILSTVPDDDSGYAPYAYMSGTSMACPHVSGVAALLVSYFGGPGFTNEDLKERLLGGGRKGAIDLQGRVSEDRMLDAYGAFTYRTGPVDPDEPVITFSTDYTGDFRFKSHENVSLTYKIDGNSRAKLPVSFDSDCHGATATCTTDRVQININALLAQPGAYSATIQVGTAATQRILFTILDNHAPVLTEPIADQIINAASASLFSIDLGGHFQDPDGETPTYTVSLSGDEIVAARLSGSTLTLTPDGYGQAEVRITASDARHESCTARFRILARNAYQELDVYPNPVSDYLFIRPAETADVEVSLYSGSGARALGDSAEAGPFTPLRLDVRQLAAGTYTLQVEFGGKKQVKTIVKY